MTQETVYFVDFDHTISKRDVWDAIVRQSAPDAWKEVIGRYVRHEISSRECNSQLCQCVKMSEPEARELVFSIGIDPTFHNFVQWIEAHNMPMTILSDGYDYYIDLLLKSEGLDHIPYFSNRMKWLENGIETEFPYTIEDCERDMAHCKCQHLPAHQDKRRVYIGDGVSDICAATKCEVIYAKRNLLEHCQEHGITHQPFEDFQEIIEHEMERLNLHPKTCETKND